MPRSHRTVLVLALLVAPVLLALAEASRLKVEGGGSSDEDLVVAAKAQIAQVAADQAGWHLHGWLAMLSCLALMGAVLGVVAATAARGPLLSLLAGLLGTTAALGQAMHFGFYDIPLSMFASVPADLAEPASRIWAAGDDDVLVLSAVAVFILSLLLAPVVLGVAVWRARVAPLWAVGLGFGGWLVSDLVGGASPLWGVARLALLLPFAFVARDLAAEPAAEERPAAVVV